MRRDRDHYAVMMLHYNDINNILSMQALPNTHPVVRPTQLAS